MQPDWLCFCTGVVPAITSSVKRVTNVGDNVVIFTPVYDIFFHSVENTGRHVLECPLVYDGKSYEIDFADLEKKLSLATTTMLILCNPHNPVGKVWQKSELERIGMLCQKYGVVVLSDEIHCDLTKPNVDYVPYASASESCKGNSITCLSASKAFNLAGLQSAAVCIPDRHLYERVVRGLNSDELAEPNAFAVTATVAAFEKGEEWLDALRAYIDENRTIVSEFLQKNLPQCKLLNQQATYLLWVDCSAVEEDSRKLCDFLRTKTGLYITAGEQYRGISKQFVRINIACPKTTLYDGLNRLQQGIKLYLSNK
jgi:cystathionine beta-lyase